MITRLKMIHPEEIRKLDFGKVVNNLKGDRVTLEFDITTRHEFIVNFYSNFFYVDGTLFNNYELIFSLSSDKVDWDIGDTLHLSIDLYTNKIHLNRIGKLFGKEKIAR